MIFGMKHHIVNLYQVCSNYTRGIRQKVVGNSRPQNHGITSLDVMKTKLKYLDFSR